MLKLEQTMCALSWHDSLPFFAPMLALADIFLWTPHDNCVVAGSGPETPRSLAPRRQSSTDATVLRIEPLVVDMVPNRDGEQLRMMSSIHDDKSRLNREPKVLGRTTAVRSLAASKLVPLGGSGDIHCRSVARRAVTPRLGRRV